MTKRNPRFEDVVGLARLNGGDYCRRPGLLAYAMNRSEGIVIRNIADSSEYRVRATGIGEANPMFSPQGDKIAFFAVDPGSGRQIFVYDLESAQVRQLTHMPGVATEALWSPDGTKIAFARVIDNSTSTQADEPIVIEDFGYKFDGRGYIKLDEHMQLYVVDVASADEHCVAAGQCDYLHHAWMPDSIHLICAGDRFRSKEQSLGYDLLKINTLNGDITQLSENLWLVSYPNPIRPLVSPDGEWVYAGVLDPAVIQDVNSVYPQVYFWRIATDGSRVAEPVFISDEVCYQCVQFPYNACGGWGLEKAQLSEDGTILYFLSGRQGQCSVFALDLEGDGHARLVAAGKQAYCGLGRLQDGYMLVSRVTTTTPEAYYLLDTKTESIDTLLYQSAQDFIDEVHIEPTEDFFFERADSSSEHPVHIHGYAIAPYGREAGKKYPTILYVHGGPTPFYTYGLTLEHHAFAAAGYGLIFCNPAGSTGYGWDLQNTAPPELYPRCCSDLLQFVDEACRRFDWIDEERLGVTGGSFGGHMTNYLATHSTRFGAYVTQRSEPSAMIMYASSDIHGESLRYENYEDFMVAMIKESDVAYAERVNKPILILHGLDDLRCPVEGAHQFYTAIRDIHPNLPCRMVLFPHTGHEQPSDPGLAHLYYQEMLDWFGAYL